MNHSIFCGSIDFWNFFFTINFSSFTITKPLQCNLLGKKLGN